MITLLRPLTFLTAISIAAGLHAQGTKEFGPHLIGKSIKFSMKGNDGKTYSSANLKGKVVVLDFWASWCGPCKRASPTMDALYKKYKKDGLVVIGIDIMESTAAGKAEAKAYPKEHGYSYIFAYGQDALGESLGIHSIPAFLFIGKNGKVAEAPIGFGPTTATDFEKTVRKLLGKG